MGRDDKRMRYYTDKTGLGSIRRTGVVAGLPVSESPVAGICGKQMGRTEDPIVKEAMSKKIVNSLLYNVDLWLPIPDNAIL